MKEDIELKFKIELSFMHNVSIDKISILHYKYIGESNYGNSGATYNIAKTNHINDIKFDWYDVSFSIKKLWTANIEGNTKILIDSKEFIKHVRKLKIKKLNDH